MIEIAEKIVERVKKARERTIGVIRKEPLMQQAREH